MKSIRLTAAIYLTISLIGLSQVHAGIRCGNDIISKGDTKMDVMVRLENCGTIMDKDSYTRESGTGETKTQTLIETWYLRVKDRGSSYCYPITFEDGVLETIGKWTRCK